MFFRKFLLLLFLSIAYCLLPVCIYSQGLWLQKSNPFATGRAGAVGFSIGTKGYFGTGWRYTTGITYNDLWEWDQATNVWTQKANFPGTTRGDGSGFSIGTKGYIGIGTTGLSYYNDFWEWDQASNTWTQKANSSASGFAFGVGFSIGTKGYFGTGGAGVKDLWEWNQSTNVWTQKANFGGGNRSNAVGFSVNGKGYVGTGKLSSVFFNDFWEYDPASNTWTQKANFPGLPRAWASGFSIGSRGYMGTGADASGNIFDDFYEWDQASNTWSQKANYPHPVSDIDHASFSISCHGYFGCGSDDPTNASIYFNDLWEYTPDNLPPVTATISQSQTICIGSSITLTASGGTNYSWNTGNSTNMIIVSPTLTTTYWVTVSTDCGSDSASTTVTIVQKGKAAFSYNYDPCSSSCVQFTDSSSNAFSWCWVMGDGSNSTTQNPCWNYPAPGSYSVTLTVNCNSGCADSSGLIITYSAPNDSVLFIPNAFSPNDDGENDALIFQMQDNHCLKEFQIAIYDRWGEKVFETNNINDSWDGTFKGQKLNSQVLDYYCKTTSATGKQIVRKGNVSLIR